MSVYVGKVVQGVYSGQMYIVYETLADGCIGCYNLTTGVKSKIDNYKKPERELTAIEQDAFRACYQELMTRNLYMFETQGTVTGSFKQEKSFYELPTIPYNQAGKSDGSSADYYKLPEGCTQLQDLISERDMNAQMGEIFRAAYRYGLASHSDKLRDAKKIKFYIEAEIARLSKCGNNS